MGDPPALPSDSQVDVEQIGQAPAWLEQLQEHVEKYCLGQMTNIAAALNTSALDTSDLDMKLNSDATVFGGFYSAYGIQAKHDAVFNAVRTSLRDLAEHLGKAADATRHIAEQYKTTEAQNKASMADIQRMLDQGTYTPKDPDAVHLRNQPDIPSGPPELHHPLSQVWSGHGTTNQVTTLAPGLPGDPGSDPGANPLVV
jgi:hypothetical protein